MADKALIALNREQLLKRIFPDNIPVLWCPLLTHYDDHGAIDHARMAAHLRHLAPDVKGFLIPGSTGDGWELTDAESAQLLEIALGQAQELRLHLLIGVLKPDVEAALSAIREIVERIKSRTRVRDAQAALLKARVCGFAVCPPRGQDLSQEELGRALSSILQAGLPTALYQLPQVTQNELSPELVSSLATRFENFLLFKDSSGADRVVLSGKSLGGVFAVRGAEGDYARWLAAAGGPYQGFLLSTANCFAPHFSQLINALSRNGPTTTPSPAKGPPAPKPSAAARQMSDRLTAVIQEVFGLVKGLPDGNPYANANKAIDHFFAFGPRALSVLPPRLHGGSRLPAEVMRATGEILSRHGFAPGYGYLE